MKRIRISEEPIQLDLFANNVVPFFYSFPVNCTDREWIDWQESLQRERERNAQAHERWKAYMYSMRCITSQFGYRAFKHNGQIIIERIPYRGEELRSEMRARNMRVIQ